MRTSKKDRRSERIPALYRLILSIPIPPGGTEVLKEMITTVEVSQHGARIRGRNTLQQGWQGFLVLLNSGIQTPCRVVWQVKPSPKADFFETGVEIQAKFNFWGRVFSHGDEESAKIAVVIEDTSIPPEEFLQALRKSSAFQAEQSGKLLESVWGGLVEQLEERKIFTRAELAASIRRTCERTDKAAG